MGNSAVLKETALIEAFNLKAAIEFQMKNYDAAREALSDMPPRGEEELDPVSLHNTALMNMESLPAQGFRKLNFLIQNPPFPPETFANLLLLYCKHQVRVGVRASLILTLPLPLTLTLTLTLTHRC